MSKMIRCLVVDDEPLAAGLIKQHIAHFPQLELVGTCWNPMEAFEILKQEAIDLLFLDIQMPLLNGLEFAKSLKNPPAIIFVTAYRDYAVESYELEVVDYLLKPVTFDRFFKSVNKFLARKEDAGPESIETVSATDEDSFIFVNSNRKYIKVSFDEVLYIESLKDYVRIHTKDQNIVTKDKISLFEKRLPVNFLRIHRSFIVNTDKVSAFTNNDVEIGVKEIPIGISYKKTVFAFFEKLF